MKLSKQQMREQSALDMAAIERGEARLLYNTWCLVDNKKEWFKRIYASMSKKYGKAYMERVRGYMTLERERDEKTKQLQATQGDCQHDGMGQG